MSQLRKNIFNLTHHLLFSIFAIALLGLLTFPVSSVYAKTTVQKVNDYTFTLTNPCNGDLLSIIGDYTIINKKSGPQFVLHNAKGTDLTNGDNYVVTYQYAAGGLNTFVVNLHLINTQGVEDYSEHDLFTFDSDGNITRSVESQTCK